VFNTSRRNIVQNKFACYNNFKKNTRLTDNTILFRYNTNVRGSHTMYGDTRLHNNTVCLKRKEKCWKSIDLFCSQAIRCTVPGCMCDCFTPGKLHIRFCDACGHGWVPHGKWTNLVFIFCRNLIIMRGAWYLSRSPTSYKLPRRTWGQTDNGRYELIYIYIYIYARSFTSYTLFCRVLDPFLLLLLLLFLGLRKSPRGS